MDTEELRRFLMRMTPELDFAITSADRLPKSRIQRPKTLVLNTDPSNRPGEHWVCFYFPEIGPAEFFDSLGHSPEYYHRNFQSLLIVNGPEYLHHTRRIQDMPKEFHTLE